MRKTRIISFERYDIFNIIVAFLLFSIVPAFYVWHSVWYSIFIVLVSGLFLINIAKKGFEKNTVVPALLFLVLYGVYILRTGLNIFGAIEVLCLMPFFIVRRESLLEIYNAFLRCYALIMALGIPFYIIAVWFGVTLPNVEIEPFNDAKMLRYFSYPFFVTQEGLFTPLAPRFFGVFDEPGVVGTISAILLVSEKFNLRKWENIIILVSGVLSASLFFFLVCGMFVLLESPMKAKIAVVVVILIAVLLLYDNEVLYEVIFRRFNFDDGGLEGMNREHGDFAAFYDKFRHSSDYWFGLGFGAGAKLNEGGSSYKQLVVDYGIVFFVVYISCYYLYALTKIRGGKQLVCYSMVLLGTMYQRPFVGTPTFTFLMIASVYAIARNYSDHRKTIVTEQRRIIQ